MNAGKRQAYIDQMAAQLEEWGAKIDVLKAKASKSAAGIRAEYHTQIESWSQKEPVFKEKLSELRSAGADAFETVKAGVHHVWTEINDLFETKKEEAKDEINEKK